MILEILNNISNFLNNDYIDRDIKIYKGFLDSNNALIVDPILIFDGSIDQPGSVERGGRADA